MSFVAKYSDEKSKRFEQLLINKNWGEETLAPTYLDSAA